MRIKILKANNGDAIHLSFQDKDNIERNILMDGGTPQTYQYLDSKKKKADGNLKITIEDLKSREKHFDLVVLTHVDDDHIGGLLTWMIEDKESFSMIDKVWFNSGKLIKECLESAEAAPDEIVLKIKDGSKKTSIKQGVDFEKHLTDHKLWDRKIFRQHQKESFYGLEITVLSPGNEQLELLLKKWRKEKPGSLTTGKSNDHGISLKIHTDNDAKITDENFEEDDAPHNGSSLAFLITYQQKNYLLFGDAFPSVLVTSLEQLGYSEANPIVAEIVKLSHHGCKLNNSKKLLKMIKSSKFVISTNSKKDHHPNKQLLARLINCHPECEIYFNYPELISKIFTTQDYADFPDFKPLPVPIAFNL